VRVEGRACAAHGEEEGEEAMTKKTPTLPRIERCVCGRIPYINEARDGDAAEMMYSIECGWACWRGPRMPTQVRAVNKWNRLLAYRYAAGAKR